MTASNISDLDDILNALREHRKYLDGNDVM